MVVGEGETEETMEDEEARVASAIRAREAALVSQAERVQRRAKRKAAAAAREAQRIAVAKAESERIGIEEQFIVQRRLATARRAKARELDAAMANVSALLPTALHALAAKVGDVDSVRWLIENKGVSVNDNDDDGDTALILAARFNHLELMDHLLMRTDVDLEKRDKYGQTALFNAAYQGHLDAARRLLVHGASPNVADQGGSQPLHVATSGGSLSMVELLLEYGADVRAVSFEGLTPYGIADEKNLYGIKDALRVAEERRFVRARHKIAAGSTSVRFAEPDAKLGWAEAGSNDVADVGGDAR
ncbi:ankyrin [Thecamonas trahens ATCC 50062]|uniref:Ankyrin n=1 Tax=Thecamonas trahens ATCC 50062 TaxID=461836 RepID=A0A0L0D8U1_THETB|nr:ankyrin [Thecamonas trahens ATCC 50062]KNC48797.1 ankyrin [Thecamonas trahens ATCC 50062]|eukprot:XP_013762848.1 ankyrin [Thecamonas trahens ATCC 50062]